MAGIGPSTALTAPIQKGVTTPWRVTEVKLDAEKQTIAVRL